MHLNLLPAEELRLPAGFPPGKDLWDPPLGAVRWNDAASSVMAGRKSYKPASSPLFPKVSASKRPSHHQFHEREALMDLSMETPTPPASLLLPIWGFSWISTGCATSKPPTSTRTSFPWSCSECCSFSCWCCQQPLNFTHLCRISAQKATGLNPEAPPFCFFSCLSSLQPFPGSFSSLPSALVDGKSRG